jgi:pimeloyl-ACP methyl ester carboxylesterase
MIPGAWEESSRYKELEMPVVIVAGEEDQLVETEKQSARLHRELPRSVLRLVRGGGHMVHQTATNKVMAAIDAAKALEKAA